METFLAGLKEQVLIFIPKAGLAFFIFALCWVAGAVGSRIIKMLGERARLQTSVLGLLRKTLQTVLILFGVISALGTLGIDVSALVAGLGLTGFALGFALRDALSNVLAGVLILIYRPFREGDRITVTGYDGVVSDIDLRYTTLQTEERRILIPNAHLFSNPVVVLETHHFAPQIH